ncbi:hypothetical protein BO221_06800 [Archangium sp. Cb G35]|uniref:Rieske 2Fe-2S domain-containing protein n=1 Tax=Archangium TaxID=47 RepID=UPI000936E0E8|nr:Rieske 2Fe-2S domain-containing protein [Archangium sp. Cb G35]OJT25575.1 hypothetical protein BO221_06800 [Archangium sp. Cb G35]WNG53580.1 Rieske 2Fe-2S domain-containing protein [Archangium gephyra]
MILQMEARHWARQRVAGERYLCLLQEGELVVVLDRCKHRGGPLSLGTYDERTQCVKCPWHDMVNTPRNLEARRMPSVRVGAVMTVVVPEPD